MQLNSIYLYPNKLDIYTNVFNEVLNDDGSSELPWTRERYQKVYQRNFKAFRGVDNRFDFQVRNSDQRSSAIPANTDLIFNLIDSDAENLVLQKQCDIISYESGRARVALTEQDLNQLPKGLYRFSVVAGMASGSTIPFYFDTQSSALGTIEVVGDVFGNPVDSKVIKVFSVIPTTWPNVDYSISEMEYASPELSTTSTLHTFVFYPTDDFVGVAKIQGSREISASPKDWEDIKIIDFPRDVRYANVQGRWNWLRVTYGPNFNPTAIFQISGDINDATKYTVFPFNPGKGYRAGQTLVFSGDRLGGTSPENDLSVVVTAVDAVGSIIGIDWTGTPNNMDRSLFLFPSDTSPAGKLDKVVYR
jgi:hypothetical protein